jgi:hypothetical protein
MIVAVVYVCGLDGSVVEPHEKSSVVKQQLNLFPYVHKVNILINISSDKNTLLVVNFHTVF